MTISHNKNSELLLTTDIKMFNHLQIYRLSFS